MDVDHTSAHEEPDYTDEDFQSYQEHLESELYYLGQKGKGKGKSRWSVVGPGKGKVGAKGKGKTGKGMGKDMKDIECFWCKKKGHYKRDCRAFLAGKPKVDAAPTGRSAGSLESPLDWEDDLSDQEASSIEINVLEIPEEADATLFDVPPLRGGSGRGRTLAGVSAARSCSPSAC